MPAESSDTYAPANRPDAGHLFTLGNDTPDNLVSGHTVRLRVSVVDIAAVRTANSTGFDREKNFTRCRRGNGALDGNYLAKKMSLDIA